MIQHEIVLEEMRATVLFDGDIDIEATEVFEEEIGPVLPQYECVELNLAKVRFVDSTGIGLLIKLVQGLQEKGAKVTITQLNSDVNEVFSLLQIPDILGKDVFE